MGKQKKHNTPYPNKQGKFKVTLESIDVTPVPIQVLSPSRTNLAILAAANPMEAETEVTVATVTQAQMEERSEGKEAGQADDAGPSVSGEGAQPNSVDRNLQMGTVSENTENGGKQGGEDDIRDEEGEIHQEPQKQQTENPEEQQEHGDAGEESWSELFMGSLTAKGMKLKYRTPGVEEGQQAAELVDTEVATSSKRWENSMIFYVIGLKPTMASIFRFIAYNWNSVAKPKVFMHDEGYFIISFDSAKDLHEILYAGPHMFFGKPTITKLWSPDFNLHDEVLRCVPIWVKFPNLPLNCWSMDSLSRIASVLGDPLCADECTTRQLRISFARVLIDIDVTQELPNTVLIKGPNGSKLQQPVVYEWTPPFCKACNKVGHDCTKKQAAHPKARQNSNQRWKPKPPTKEALIPGATYIEQSENQVQQKHKEKQPLIPAQIAYPTKEYTEGEGWKVVPKKHWTTTRANISASSSSNFILLQDLPEDGILAAEEGGGDDNPVPVP